MNLKLQGKRSIVLASSSGLGYASARQLAEEGADVIVCSRDESRSSEAVERIHTEVNVRSDQKVLYSQVDVSDADSVSALFDFAQAQLGGLDLLVCNAGGPPPGSFEKHDDSAWHQAFELTLMSVVRSVRAARPLLRESDSAAVVVIGSSSVKRPIPNLLMSNVFRPAVHALVNDISADLAGEGIRINMVSPGRIHTARVDQLDAAKAEREGKSADEVRQASLKAMPLGRLGTPEEFANTVVYLLSDAASYVTGDSILVDGGMVRAL